jgi:hypothetical protein
MKRFFRKLTVVFCAGVLGGLANSLAVWLFGVYGFNKALDVRISPDLSAPWLYQRLIWGGIWGVLFLLPLLQSHPVRKGLLLSLGPTLVQLFVIFPYKTHDGMLGLELGALTPLVILAVNAIWGIVAALWAKYIY